MIGRENTTEEKRLETVIDRNNLSRVGTWLWKQGKEKINDSYY